MERSCIRINKSSADDAIKKFRADGLLDTTYQIQQIGNFVYIPLIKHIDGATMHDFRPREDVFARIEHRLRNMGLRNESIQYIRLGNSLIFKGKISLQVAREYASELGVDNIYAETGKIQGVRRKPSLKLVYGSDKETVVMESGIKYIMNLQKVMFSPGNINTRSNMKFVDLTGRVVIDMFCGIGYFSLQVLKNSRPARMLMCDINPDSIYYLKRNLPANRIKSPVDIYTGDSRVALPLIKADYIIMGNFNSFNFITSALLRSEVGTEISMHYLTTTEKRDKALFNIIELARKMGYIITCTETIKVKSVGPHYLHINTVFKVIQIL
jgi:tRNA wybutosine-synthesizing protein 2